MTPESPIFWPRSRYPFGKDTSEYLGNIPPASRFVSTKFHSSPFICSYSNQHPALRLTTFCSPWIIRCLTIQFVAKVSSGVQGSIQQLGTIFIFRLAPCFVVWRLQLPLFDFLHDFSQPLFVLSHIAYFPPSISRLDSRLRCLVITLRSLTIIPFY